MRLYSRKQLILVRPRERRPGAGDRISAAGRALSFALRASSGLASRVLKRNRRRARCRSTLRPHRRGVESSGDVDAEYSPDEQAEYRRLRAPQRGRRQHHHRAALLQLVLRGRAPGGRFGLGLDHRPPGLRAHQQARRQGRLQGLRRPRRRQPLRGQGRRHRSRERPGGHQVRAAQGRQAHGHPLRRFHAAFESARKCSRSAIPSASSAP